MTSASIATRPLTAADEADWRRLWTAYLAFYETSRGEDVFASTFARLLDPAEPMRGLVATRDGAVVGIANIILHRHGWSVADVCYLQDLFVDPAVRGGGAGRALIEATYALADAEGCAGVYWMTDQSNAAARALYDRIGKLTPFIKYARP
ncbi:MAG: GNAT family N-acetyltransferase [Rubrimonas sp.]